MFGDMKGITFILHTHTAVRMHCLPLRMHAYALPLALLCGLLELGESA
jgi:hypothetical protein